MKPLKELLAQEEALLESNVLVNIVGGDGCLPDPPMYDEDWP